MRQQTKTEREPACPENTGDNRPTEKEYPDSRFLVQNGKDCNSKLIHPGWPTDGMKFFRKLSSAKHSFMVQVQYIRGYRRQRPVPAQPYQTNLHCKNTTNFIKTSEIQRKVKNFIPFPAFAIWKRKTERFFLQGYQRQKRRTRTSFFRRCGEKDAENHRTFSLWKAWIIYINKGIITITYRTINNTCTPRNFKIYH